MYEKIEWYSAPNRGFEFIQQDKIDVNATGFHWRSHGRTANLYFVENRWVTIIYAEMSGVSKFDVLVFGETAHVNKRYYPSERKIEHLPQEDRLRIQRLLVNWLDGKSMRHDITLGK